MKSPGQGISGSRSRPTYRRGMGRDSDRRVYWFAATALFVVVGLVAAFLW